MVKTLEEVQCRWIVRLNKGIGMKITDEEGKEIPLVIEKGEIRQIGGAYYRGEQKVNVASLWKEGCREPLWIMGIMGNLPTGDLLGLYQERMKIEQPFKDSKSLLIIEKIMSNHKESS